MNPAALKVNLNELPAGGALIVNEDAFTATNLAKAGYQSNPLKDGSLHNWNVFSIPISTLNTRALEGLEMKEGDDFPQGDKLLRKDDHQAFLREFIYELRGGKYKILEVIPKEKTLVPPACKFA